MIDPTDCIDYNRSDAALEEWFMFCCLVAGKRADMASKSLHCFLEGAKVKYGEMTPFAILETMMEDGSLENALIKARTGKYDKLLRLFSATLALRPNLRTCSLEELESIYGIGKKTSRYFMMGSRPNQRIAALDTHILKFLRSLGLDAPKNTPTSDKKYKELEKAFIDEADRQGKDVAAFDLELWNEYSSRNGSQFAVAK